MRLRRLQHLSGHTDRVWCVAWAPTGRILASCSGDKTVRIWQPSSAALDGPWICTAVLEEVHQRTIRACAWDRNGRYLALASFDGTTSIWCREGEEWECVSTLEGHENEVKSVAWSPVSDMLATCGRDKTVWIWEMGADHEFSCMSVQQGHSQDVKMVAWHPTGEMLMSASYDNSIKLWMEDADEEDWCCVKTLAVDSGGQGHSSTVWALDVDATGERMVSCSDDLSIIVWEQHASAGMAGAVAVGWEAVCSITGFHTRTIYSVQWAPPHTHGGTRMLASVAGDNSLRVFAEDAEAAAEAAAAEPGVAPRPSYSQLAVELHAHEQDVNCVRWCPTAPAAAPLLATASDDGCVCLWTLQAL